MVKLNEFIQQPGQKELAIREYASAGTHVAVPGEIISYDSSTRTAKIQPLIRKRNSQKNPPILQDVPVFFPGKWVYSVEPGDECLVVFADGCIDAWFENSGVSSPVSARKHDLSDGFAFVGFRSKKKVTPGTDIDQELAKKKDTQDPVTDPTASGSGVEFISGISQNNQGVISPEKKTVRTMTGASSDVAGATGLVPAPASGDQGKYLRGDGTWHTPDGSGVSDMTGATSGTAGTHGLVPAPAAGDQVKFLRGDATWANEPNMTGATSSAAGSAGLVPAPASGDQGKFLRGDGTWQAPSGFVLKSGDTMTGNLNFANTETTSTIGNTPRGVYGKVGTSDAWRIIGYGGSNDGHLEIATADDGTEPIYVRQYTYNSTDGDFGSITRTATLLDASGNTSFPGTVTASSFSGNASSATQVKVTGISSPSSGSVTNYFTFCGSTTTGNQDIKDISVFRAWNGPSSCFFIAGSASTVGGLTLYNSKFVDVKPATLTANRALTIPDADGTVCLTNTYASTSQSGVVSTGAQSFAGLKSFTSRIEIDFSGTNGTKATPYIILTAKMKNAAGSATYTYNPIRILGTDGTDTYNSGVVLGSQNGTTVIGAGESSDTMPAKIGAYNDENLYLIADGTIKFYTNCANDASSYGGPVTISGTTITGNLTGNVTGNCSGSSGSCTGHAASDLALSGGTMTGNITLGAALNVQKAGQAVTWIKGRDSAIAKITSYSGYNAATSMKTTNGSWENGVCASNIMYWTYVPDTKYNANDNTGFVQMYLTSDGYLYAPRVYNAVWNDYAEMRKGSTTEGGYCMTEAPGGMIVTDRRMQRGCRMTSDTFGSCMGETDEAKTPIAVAGRVLARPYRDRRKFKLGAPVCSAPGGKVDIMHWWEVILHPECIVGTVSEIPDYEAWKCGSDEHPKEVKVDGRIWIYVR